MHRSCKALLCRGASLERHFVEIKKLYKVSLSVVLMSWVFLFFLSSFIISRGNCLGDGMGAVIGGLTINEVKPVEVSASEKLVVSEEDESEACDQNIGSKKDENVNTKNEPPNKEQNGDSKLSTRNEEVVIKSSNSEAKEEKVIPLKSENLSGSVPRSMEKEVLEITSDAATKMEKTTPLKIDKLSEDAPKSVEIKQVLEEHTGPGVDSEEKTLPKDDISSDVSPRPTEKQQLLEDTSHSEEKLETSFPKSDNFSSSSDTYVDQVSKEHSDSGVTAEKSALPKDDTLSDTVPRMVEKEQVLENATYSGVRAEKSPPTDNVPRPVEKEQVLDQHIDSGSKAEKTVPKNDKLAGNVSRTLEKEQALEEHSDSGSKLEKRCPPKSDKKSRVAPSLGEFKSKTLTAKDKYGTGLLGSVKNRVEPGGKEYNYASSSKGAKVLAFNKEAKGASNILGKDKDKYLRNPCSAEAKHVILELSEETLVHTIEIGNFEHYSSNLKDFELLSSLIFPTDSWTKIANFTATNVRHKQRFEVPEPKWARYLKLNLLSHYGSEFYCTLSVLKVYGVDAVETMLEDLISVQDNHFVPEEPKPAQPSLLEAIKDDLYTELLSEYYGSGKETITNTQHDVPKKNSVDLALGADTRPPQLGRMPGDTVLKILMQKVRSLDVNADVLERYLEDLNSRYGKIFKDIDNDIDDKDLILEQIRSEVETLRNNQDAIRVDIRDLYSWRYVSSLQLEGLVEENTALRLEVEKVRYNQVDIENRTLVVILISFCLGCFAIFKLVVDLLTCTCNIGMSENLSRSSSGWFLLLLSSTLITFIIAL